MKPPIALSLPVFFGMFRVPGGVLALALLLPVLLWADPQPNAGSAQGGGVVLVVRVTDMIDPGLSFFIRRVFARGEREQVRGVILEINSTGGLVESCLEIKDKILNSPLTSVAFIENRALSAAALISLSCTKIAMKNNSSIGAAAVIQVSSGGTPNTISTADVDAKTTSAFRAEFETTADKRGRPKLICAGMVDRMVAIPNLKKPGEILTLLTDEAVQQGVADFNINNISDLLAQMGWSQCRIERLEPTSGERIARFFTNLNVSGALMGIGMLGMLTFFFMGSLTGLATGMAAFSLVYGAHIFAGISSVMTFAIFLGGLMLLAVEVFILPGFGFVGVSGILLIILSAALAFETPWAGFSILSKGLFLTMIGVPVIWRMGGRFVFNRLFVNHEKIGSDGDFQEATMEVEYGRLVGQEGVATTLLRPGGKVMIAGKRYDGVAENGFIDKDSHVKVIATRDNTLIVEPLL